MVCARMIKNNINQFLEVMMQTEERKYTQGEEFVNAFSHALGALFAIYAIVMLAFKSSNVIEATTTSIYGAMLFVLFQASTCYHAMVNETAKKVFQKIDHSAIYMLIAGTYTPILMLALDKPYSIILMAMIWYLAVTGIVFSCLTLKFKKLSTAIYVIMGWLSLFLFYILWLKGFKSALVYLFTGGVLYTFGSYFYLKNKKFYHGIWHLFVLAGAILHYCAIASML